MFLTKGTEFQNVSGILVWSIKSCRHVTRVLPSVLISETSALVHRQLDKLFVEYYEYYFLICLTSGGGGTRKRDKKKKKKKREEKRKERKRKEEKKKRKRKKR